MFKSFLAAFAVVISLCATVAHGQEPNREVSPAAAAEAQPHVQALQQQAAQAAAEAEAKAPNAAPGSPIALAIAALKVRVTELEAASKQLTAARHGAQVKWKVVTKAISPFNAELCNLKEALQNLRADVAATKVGLKKVAAVAGEARQRAKQAQASADEANDGVNRLQGEVRQATNTANNALRLATTPPPKTVFTTLSVFTGWSSEKVVGLGLGLETPFSKLESRVSTSFGNYREVGALVALRADHSAWINPYGGLNYVGVFSDGFAAGLTDNRVGVAIGNSFKLMPAIAIDVRLNGDVGADTTVFGGTVGISF